VRELVKWHAVLQSEANQYGGVVHQHIQQAVGAIGVEENFANTTIGEISDRHPISSAIALELNVL
jgi:hypothetical protein